VKLPASQLEALKELIKMFEHRKLGPRLYLPLLAISRANSTARSKADDDGEDT